MIPKTIHYCWFGGKELPRSARKCISSWRKFFPDHEIKLWNETNFDVNAIAYTGEAYERKKYAFVSDYARFLVIYNHGGIYFDTDVEVIRPFDDILERGAFMGMEQFHGVAPGLGIGAEAGHGFYREILSYYETMHYVNSSGEPFEGTVVKHTTELLQRRGLVLQDRFQTVAGINIYPNDYFNPLDDATGRIAITDNTRSIHRYSKTWIDNYSPLRNWLTRRLHRLVGVENSQRIKSFFGKGEK